MLFLFLYILSIYKNSGTFFRESTKTLMESVPELADYKVLRSQFEWLMDGPICHLVKQNLSLELADLELFLRSLHYVNILL